MPRPRELPEDDRHLEKLIREHGAAEVARMYGVTPQAVSLAIRSRKLHIDRRISYDRYIPWKRSEEHKNHQAVKMLRVYGDLQEGRPVSEERLRWWELFRQRLDEEGLVVDYNVADGFYLVPREPGDEGYIRRPTDRVRI